MVADVAVMDMPCREPGCEGLVGFARFVEIMPFRPDGRFMVRAYACNLCGRLHWAGGEPVFNQSNQPGFFDEGAIAWKTEAA